MKRVILICGTMGVGKTRTCRELQKVLDRNVFLDGDWCWDAQPFVVNDFTKRMVVDNIVYMLDSFIACPDYENVIFCWVMHQQAIIDSIVSRLKGKFDLSVFALTCSRDALERRIMGDVAAGLRKADVIGRSAERLALYGGLKGAAIIDTTNIAPDEAARMIADKLMQSTRGKESI